MLFIVIHLIILPIRSYLKSHNALDYYPTMHHFVTAMCTRVHISVTKWCTVGYGTGSGSTSSQSKIKLQKHIYFNKRYSMRIALDHGLPQIMSCSNTNCFFNSFYATFHIKIVIYVKIFHCLKHIFFPSLLVKYVFQIYTTRVPAIAGWIHYDTITWFISRMLPELCASCKTDNYSYLMFPYGWHTICYHNWYIQCTLDPEIDIARSKHAATPRAVLVNTMRPRQSWCYFADAIFKRIFLNENVWISLKNFSEICPKFRINNIPSLVHIMAWRRPGAKPLSEPMMVSLLGHTCATRPQWFKALFRLVV